MQTLQSDVVARARPEQMRPRYPDETGHVERDGVRISWERYTAMELTASRRPFLYFPLERHFEQRYHVSHRLERYRAGRRMEFADSPPGYSAEAGGGPGRRTLICR